MEGRGGGKAQGVADPPPKKKLKFSNNGRPGLPDFSLYNVPKWGKIYQMDIKYTK
jgi:hypothetical protein